MRAITFLERNLTHNDVVSGYKDDSCSKKSPYRVVFRRIELTPSAKYEVVMPKQKGLAQAATDPFTATES